MAHQGQITQHDNCCTDKQGMWSDNGSVKDDLSGDVLLICPVVFLWVHCQNYYRGSKQVRWYFLRFSLNSRIELKKYVWFYMLQKYWTSQIKKIYIKHFIDKDRPFVNTPVYNLVITLLLTTASLLSFSKSIRMNSSNNFCCNFYWFNYPCLYCLNSRLVYNYWFLYPRSPKGEGGILFYLCLSKIFFVAFFSVTVDGRNLIFGHKHHIGIAYCG